MARLCFSANELATPDVAEHIASATVELAQALIAGADLSSPRSQTLLNEAMQVRIVEFILLHLCDEGLTPERIASAHNISLRHLYRLWADEELGVAEWIVAERLARAADALADSRLRHRSIAAVAFSLGFSNAAHFSRRFRGAYGVSPRAWRQQTHDEGRIHQRMRGPSARSAQPNRGR